LFNNHIGSIIFTPGRSTGLAQPFCLTDVFQVILKGSDIVTFLIILFGLGPGLAPVLPGNWELVGLLFLLFLGYRF